MTFYIFNLSVFQTNFLIIFYYYILKGEGSIIDEGKTIICAAGCNSVCRTENVNLKFHPFRIIGFIDAEGRIIVIIIENKKLHKKIIIRRSTIVVLPNALETSAPQLQNTILPQPGWNYSTLATSRTSVENFQRDALFVTAFNYGSRNPVSLLSLKLLTTRFYSAVSKKVLVLHS